MEIKSITKCRKPLGEKMPKFQLCDAGMNKQQFSGNGPNHNLMAHLCHTVCESLQKEQNNAGEIFLQYW